MKKLLSLVLCFAFLFCLSSCNETDDFQSEKIIAVEYASANEVASAEYVSDGYTKATYNSSSDVVLAVENKKADFGILNEIEFNSFVQAKRNIKKKAICEYQLDYCAYFNSENANLQQSFDDAINELKADGTLEKIKNAHLNGEKTYVGNTDNENGTLTMLCDPNFDNRIYTDENGEIVGLDVDVAREICSYLGYDLEIKISDVDELLLKLDEGEGDFVISALEVNEERAEYYLLSDSYFTLNFYLIERS